MGETWTTVTRSPEESEALGRSIGELARKGDVIGLEGSLGAGKTTLARGIARGLGVEDHVSSPTFILMHLYAGRVPVFHFDVYRLADGSELLDLGFEEYAYDAGVTIVEWADRVQELLPPDHLILSIQGSAGGAPSERRVTFTAAGGNAERILLALRPAWEKDRPRSRPDAG